MGPGLAHESDNPTVAILQFGSLTVNDLTIAGIRDQVVSTGMLTDAEAALYSQREDFEGEQVNIVFGSASFDFVNLSAVIGGGACIKPDHDTGSEIALRCDDIVALLLLQVPDMKTIGTVYSSAEASGR